MTIQTILYLVKVENLLMMWWEIVVLFIILVIHFELLENIKHYKSHITVI